MSSGTGPSWSQRGLAARLAVAVPLVHAGLLLLGFSRTRRVLRLTSPAPGPNTASSQAGSSAELSRVARGAARSVQRYSPIPGSCLSRSLALWWILRWRGLRTSLVLGTRRLDGSFQAHAWLTLHGRPLNAGRRVRENYRAFEHDFGEPSPRQLPARTG